MLADAARAGLLSVGCRVLDLGIVATPTAGIMVVERGAAAGMVITASHNPTPWNGIKCLDGRGVAPSVTEAAALIEAFTERRAGYAAVGSIPTAGADDGGHRVHVDRVLPLVDVDAIRAAAPLVVLDSVHGAGGPAGRMLLEELGCRVIHLGAEPHGRFQHPPEPVREHLAELSEAVRREGAAVGFAQDPDADRLALVDGDGTYIGEEYTLVLAAAQMLTRHGRGVMAANLSTSRMIDDVAAAHGAGPVIRTAVGEANVADGMMRAAAAGEGGGGHPLIGGEGNGGVIVPAVGWVRDSISAMALVLDAMATRGRTLAELVAEIPRYAIVKDKLDLAAVGGRDAIAGILEGTRTLFPGGTVNDADGVRVDIGETWVHVRASNTEPILRIIAEAADEADARALIARVRTLLG
jgi:phosphomannomutase